MKTAQEFQNEREFLKDLSDLMKKYNAKFELMQDHSIERHMPWHESYLSYSLNDKSAFFNLAELKKGKKTIDHKKIKSAIKKVVDHE